MSDNPQFKRTDKAIMQALVSLLGRKAFEKITVQDILDETPVTRATFYAHYRDKYEIAEKMLNRFIESRDNIRKSLASPSHPSLEILNQNYQLDPNFIHALMKIHTENVDLRKALAAELEKEYLTAAAGPTREMEARIYAQAYAEFYLSVMNMQHADISPEYTYGVFISVALGMLHLTDDWEARKYLENRIERKANSAKD